MIYDPGKDSTYKVCKKKHPGSLKCDQSTVETCSPTGKCSKRKKKKIKESLMTFEEFFENECNVCANELEAGDHVENINSECDHFRSTGVIKGIKDIPQDDEKTAGRIVLYVVTNDSSDFPDNEVNGKFSKGDKLAKTEIQLKKLNSLNEGMFQNITDPVGQLKSTLGVFGGIISGIQSGAGAGIAGGIGMAVGAVGLPVLLTKAANYLNKVAEGNTTKGAHRQTGKAGQAVTDASTRQALASRRVSDIAQHNTQVGQGKPGLTRFKPGRKIKPQPAEADLLKAREGLKLILNQYKIPMNHWRGIFNKLLGAGEGLLRAPAIQLLAAFTGAGVGGAAGAAFGGGPQEE